MSKAYLNDLVESFSFRPEIVHSDKLNLKGKILFAAMGGSALAGHLFKAWHPDIHLAVVSDYIDKIPDYASVIFCSYSGETEEEILGAKVAHEQGSPMLVITGGGALLKFARENEIPHIVIPHRPYSAARFAVGAMLHSLSLVLRPADESIYREAAEISLSGLEGQGQRIIEAIDAKVPVIYSSSVNEAIAYYWKIAFNENAKMMSTHNILPEANHNELEAVLDRSRMVKDTFAFILLTDPSDNPHIKTRMELVESMYQESGVRVAKVELAASSRFSYIVKSVLLADWTTCEMAERTGEDPLATPAITSFKKKLQNV